LILRREEFLAVFALELLDYFEFSFSPAFLNCAFTATAWAYLDYICCLILHLICFMVQVYKSDGFWNFCFVLGGGFWNCWATNFGILQATDSGKKSVVVGKFLRY